MDDGSTDRTAELAAAAGALVCRLPFNLGVGGAMRAGYRYALRHGYDVAVQIDADGQHDPTYLPGLLDALDHADLVIGARFAGRGESTRPVPAAVAMRVLAGTLSRMAGATLTDVTSGFRVANRRAVALFATHYPAEYLGDTVESTVIAVRAGCTVTQVPVEMRPRQAGQASQTPGARCDLPGPRRRRAGAGPRAQVARAASAAGDRRGDQPMRRDQLLISAFLLSQVSLIKSEQQQLHHHGNSGNTMDNNKKHEFQAILRIFGLISNIQI